VEVEDPDGCNACADADAGISAANSSAPADTMRPPRGELAFVAIMTGKLLDRNNDNFAPEMRFVTRVCL
jgi:hypothetical protein